MDYAGEKQIEGIVEDMESLLKSRFGVPTEEELTVEFHPQMGKMVLDAEMNDVSYDHDVATLVEALEILKKLL